MIWQIVVSDKAKKQLVKFDNVAKSRILNFLNQDEIKIDPKSSGKALIGNFKGLWRYRVGDYRIICELKKQEVVVLVLNISHRKDVYNTISHS